MNGTSSFTSAGVTIETSSIPHAFADDMRRCSSCIRSSVRATSMPPLSVKTPASRYWRTESSVSCVISFEWSTGKMKFDAWPVEPPGFGSGPLSSSTRSVQPSSREVADEAVADDAGADHDRARGRGPGRGLSHGADISRLEQHVTHRLLEVLDVRAHQRGGPFALAAGDRLEQRRGARAPRPADPAPGRARAPRSGAHGCSTTRASPPGAGCGCSGRSHGGSARRGRSAARSSRRRSTASSSSSALISSRSDPRGPLRGEPRRLGLEHRPHLAEPREVADVDRRHEHAAPRVDLDEPLEREPAQRLPHRRAADAEPRGQLGLLDRGARRELQRDDQLAQRVVGPVGERRDLAGRRGQEPSGACPSHGDILVVSCAATSSRRKGRTVDTTMPSSLQIAQEATLRPITEIAAAAGLAARRDRPVRPLQGEGQPRRSSTGSRRSPTAS